MINIQYFSVEIEFFSLLDQTDLKRFKRDPNLKFLTPNMKKSKLENELSLTNAMFINGLSLNIDDTSSCQETQIDFSKDFSTCSDNDIGCNKIVPDPRNYNLSDDFIFVEQEWGSLFYKHIGKRSRSEAKMLCSEAGPTVRDNNATTRVYIPWVEHP